MPAIINYPTVLHRMKQQGLRSLYYNSGSFGFASEVSPIIVGWSVEDDPSIRPEMRPLVRQVQPAEARTLAELAMRFWQQHTAGPAWVMPMSHWAFELDHGSRGWLPAALERIGTDPSPLAGRSDGAALDFAREEWPSFRRFMHDLLANLTTSDFLIAFPGLPLLCTIHHHRQLWWQTTDQRLAALLREWPGPPPSLTPEYRERE